MTSPTTQPDDASAEARQLDWPALLLDQLTFHWESHLRPKLDGLTDEELFWEPVPGCWNVRPRAEARTPMAAGGGELVADFEWPEPDPVPFTTIAWRLAHLDVGVFGGRNASHFGGPPVDYASYEYPATAAEALERLDERYSTWVSGVTSLGASRLADPVGPAEGPYAEHPYAALILHIHREVIHHGAEVLVLRDLYRHRTGA